MAEPTTTTLAIASIGSVTLSTVLLGLDGNAVVGAFSGAVLMVMSAKDIRWPSRVVYLVISCVMGYIAAPEIIDNTPIDHLGVGAFIASALIVTVTLQAIERAKTLDLFSWLRRGGGGHTP